MSNILRYHFPRNFPPPPPSPSKVCFNSSMTGWYMLIETNNFSNTYFLRSAIQLTTDNFVRWEPEGRYHSKMIHWEPEGCYHHRLCIEIAPFCSSMEHLWIFIAPFWFSTEHLWILIVPFWFSTEHLWISIAPFWFSMEHLWILIVPF